MERLYGEEVKLSPSVVEMNDRNQGYRRVGSIFEDGYPEIQMFVVFSHYHFLLPVFDQREKGVWLGGGFTCFQAEATDEGVSNGKQSDDPRGQSKYIAGDFFGVFAGCFPDLESILIVDSSESNRYAGRSREVG